MILELDCGNTRIKWRLLKVVDGTVAARGALKFLEDIQPVLIQYALQIRYCRVCSVRSEAFAQEVSQLVGGAIKKTVEFAHASARLRGVTNSYSAPEKMGVDRWLAMVAAFSSSETACLIIDCGTAITVDFVGATGCHLGGVIAPGVQALQESVLSRTDLPFRAIQGLNLRMGQNTLDAIEAGIMAMLQGFLLEQLNTAEQVLEKGFKSIVTGGDGHLVMKTLSQAVYDADLVFKGLALACPYKEI